MLKKFSTNKNLKNVFRIFKKYIDKYARWVYNKDNRKGVRVSRPTSKNGPPTGQKGKSNMFLINWLFPKRQHKPVRSYYEFGHPDISVMQVDCFRPSHKELTVLYNNKQVTRDQARFCATHDEPNQYVWVYPREIYLKMVKSSGGKMPLL